MLKRIVWPAFIILALIVLAAFYRDLVTIIFLAAVGAISFLHKYFRLGLGFELVTFGAVIGGISFGPIAGMLIGIAGSLAGFIITADFHGGMILAVALFGIFGLIAGIFSHVPVLLLGISLAVIYDLVFIGKNVLMGKNPLLHTLFYATHLIGNYWAFRYLAPQFL